MTPESKKEEFRKYLEKSGVIDALTKVLVGLYEEPERPPNAVDYIKRYMGAPTGVDAEAMRLQNEEFKKENDDLRSKLQSLTEKLMAKPTPIYSAASTLFCGVFIRGDEGRPEGGRGGGAAAGARGRGGSRRKR
eukprot:jgi/Undpi1/3276/HiC_scaffold_15.g06650.m1